MDSSISEHIVTQPYKEKWNTGTFKAAQSKVVKRHRYHTCMKAELRNCPAIGDQIDHLT